MDHIKQLTKNFNEREFVCHCCGELVLDSELVICLQMLRDLLGEPITVNCGYRCLKHNRELGSKDTSQHRLGKAADITAKNKTPGEVARKASEIPKFKCGGIGVYNTFTHLDIRENGPARWGKKWSS